LLGSPAPSDRDLVNEQLQNALDSRVLLEQSKGVLSCRGDLEMPAAYAALRAYARDHNIKLTERARALVSRALPAARRPGARPDTWRERRLRPPSSLTVRAAVRGIHSGSQHVPPVTTRKGASRRRPHTAPCGSRREGAPPPRRLLRQPTRPSRGSCNVPVHGVGCEMAASVVECVRGAQPLGHVLRRSVVEDGDGTGDCA
jgi:hypothetical protein